MNAFFLNKKNIYILFSFILVSLIVVFLFFFFKSDQGSVRKTQPPDNEAFIVAGMKKCFEASNKKSCFQEEADSFLDYFSVKEILEVFARHENDTEFFSTCHEMSHYLGQKAYKRLGSVSKVYEQSDQTCLGGVFHGTIEGYFIENNLTLGTDNLPQIKEAVATICDEKNGYQNEMTFSRCRHGLGHALLFVAEDDVHIALALCDVLEKKTECYTGVLMQNVNNYGSQDHPNAMIKEDDPMYPCSVLGEKYQETCYTYAILLRYQGDIDKTIEICSAIPEKFRKGCFMTYGRDGILFTEDLTTLRDRCKPIKDAVYYNACVVAVSNNLVTRYGLESSLPLSYCALLEGENKTHCYETTGYFGRSLTSDQNEVIDFCNKVSLDQDRKSCKKGAGMVQ